MTGALDVRKLFRQVTCYMCGVIMRCVELPVLGTMLACVYTYMCMQKYEHVKLHAYILMGI